MGYQIPLFIENSLYVGYTYSMNKNITASPFNLRESVSFIVTVLLITLVGFGGLTCVLFLTQASKEIAFTALALAVPSISLLIIAFSYWHLRQKKLTWIDIGLRRPTRRLLHLFWQLPLMLIILLVTQAMFFSLGNFDSASNPDAVGQLSSNVPVFAAVALLLGVSILIPFWEEIVFRGVIYGGLRRKWGILFSVFVSGIIFAAAHAIPMLLPYFVVAGVIFSLIYEFHKTLWASLIAHVFINSLASLILFMALLARF